MDCNRKKLGAGHTSFHSKWKKTNGLVLYMDEKIRLNQSPNKFSPLANDADTHKHMQQQQQYTKKTKKKKRKIYHKARGLRISKCCITYDHRYTRKLKPLRNPAWVYQY